jgi:preprotein translocase subunit SecE
MPTPEQVIDVHTIVIVVCSGILLFIYGAAWAVERYRSKKNSKHMLFSPRQ